MAKEFDLCGLGNALVDILLELTDEEFGVYWKLLLIAWQRGSIFADVASNARFLADFAEEIGGIGVQRVADFQLIARDTETSLGLFLVSGVIGGVQAHRARADHDQVDLDAIHRHLLVMV